MFSLDSLCNKISRQRRHHVQKSQKQMLADSRQTPNTFLLASLQHAPLLSYYALFPNTSHLHFHLVIESMHSQLTEDYELGWFEHSDICTKSFLLSYISHLFVSFFQQKVWFGVSILQSLRWDQVDRLKIQAVNHSYKKEEKNHLAHVLFFELSRDDNTQA